MVPVQLRLQNFLSYGTAADTLDFDQFHVACLSGGNGQGKSALLDAVTWALWGEARKSGDARKPDAELLRVGAREMQVEFTFDLEGERYRVLRSYYETASGKSTRPGLEIQVLDVDSDAFRPLTTGSIRESQQALDDLLRIDYHTFINSSFLLQGRSDEFTKKKASERKQILAKILNLDRYARLADLAGEKARAADTVLKQVDFDVQRLTEALEGVGVWEEERTAVVRETVAAQAQLRALQTEDAALAEKLAVFDARARERDSLRASVAEKQARRQRLEQERQALVERIDEAERTLRNDAAIRDAYQRHQKLTEERNALDDRRDLARGIEQQLQTARQTLQTKKLDLETRLYRHESERSSHQRVLDNYQERLVREPRWQAELAEATRAQDALKRFDEIAQRQQILDEQIRKLDSEIGAHRAKLEGQLRQLETSVAQKREALGRSAALRGRIAQLETDAARYTELREQRDRVRQQGTEARSHLDAAKQRIDVLDAKIAALRQQQDKMRTLEAETCPTCSTQLTEHHRDEVVRYYEREIEAVAAQRAEIQRETADYAEQRQGYADQYKALDTQMSAHAEAPQQLAAVKSQVERLAADEAELEAHQQQVGEIRGYLADNSFATDLRARKETLVAERRTLVLDEAAHTTARTAAARLEGVRTDLAELEPIKERALQLKRKIEHETQEITALRQALEGGAVLRQEQDKIARLDQQLASVGYDAERHQAVRRQLEELHEAPARFEGLLNARENLDDWTTRRDQMAGETAELATACTSLAAHLAALEAELSNRDTFEGERTTLGTRINEAHERLRQLQTRTGELDARLEQARQDREVLKAHKKAQREARKQKSLYSHLRRAFGKNGIPALIIEQTLPEIEERANELLQRLTDGRTSVKLETLKDKKTGGTKETLDIKIIDELGVSRAYEMFSGGEAFRVNFALRIALSQLLAERAGVRIRTLVIDEGFGTQDAQGIQNMIEAIQTVKDDFQKILVITHLSELKEAFPVRIEVQKEPVIGSRFDVIGV